MKDKRKMMCFRVDEECRQKLKMRMLILKIDTQHLFTSFVNHFINEDKTTMKGIINDAKHSSDA